MGKVLVSYFSCTGQTKRLAETIADVVEADIHEIVPEVKYSNADLDWRNKTSRSTLEMNALTSRPKATSKVDNMDDYDTVFVGFPIWWYDAPRIIATFLENYDFSNKTVIPFATSGSSGMGNIDKNLQALCSKDTKWKTGKRLKSNESKSSVENWIAKMNL